MRYSQRNGYKPLPSSSFEGIHPDLKNAIWTRVYKIIDDYVSYGIAGYGNSAFYKPKIVELLWTELFNKNISDLPYAGEFVKEINEIYKKLEWFEVYDLIEWIVNSEDDYYRKKLSAEFNQILEKYNSPVRVINGLIQEISDKELAEKLTDAVEQAPNEIVKSHLKEAEKLYSDRKSANFKLSCLESIKAVEACLQDRFGNKNILGDNVRKLKSEQKMNQHVVEILTKINAFRGNDVAHADKSGGYDISKYDAILVHIFCVGLVDYIKSIGAVGDK